MQPWTLCPRITKRGNVQAQQPAAYALPGAPAPPPPAAPPQLFGGPDTLRLAHQRFAAGHGAGEGGGGGSGGGSELDLRQLAAGGPVNPAGRAGTPALNPTLNPFQQFRRAGAHPQLLSVGSAPLGGRGGGGGGGGRGSEGAPMGLLHASASTGTLKSSPGAPRQTSALLQVQQQAQARLTPNRVPSPLKTLF